MADQKQKVEATTPRGEHVDHTHGRSGGNMGAGKSGHEDLGIEKPGDEMGSGSHKPSDHGEKQLRAHDDKDSAHGGGSNQSRDKGGPETDATGGRRARHNDDNDKYNGRGGGNRGKGS